MDGSKEKRKDGWEKGIVFRKKERNIVKRNIRKEKRRYIKTKEILCRRKETIIKKVKRIEGGEKNRI